MTIAPAARTQEVAANSSAARTSLSIFLGPQVRTCLLGRILSALPLRHDALLMAGGAELRSHADARHPGERVPDEQQRHAFAFPRRHCSFLQQILQRSARAIVRLPHALTAAAAAYRHAGLCEIALGDPFAER